jgi:hypothetical protein
MRNEADQYRLTLNAALRLKLLCRGKALLDDALHPVRLGVLRQSRHQRLHQVSYRHISFSPRRTDEANTGYANELVAPSSGFDPPVSAEFGQKFRVTESRRFRVVCEGWSGQRRSMRLSDCQIDYRQFNEGPSQLRCRIGVPPTRVRPIVFQDRARSPE